MRIGCQPRIYEFKRESKNDFGKMYNENLHNLYVLYSSPKHKVIRKTKWDAHMSCTEQMIYGVLIQASEPKKVT
jgi:hypothetical protein